MPRAVFDYVDGGADAEISLGHNREVLNSIRFAPSVLRRVADTDLGVTTLGRRSALPFALAPTGFTRLMHHSGEVAVAEAAQSAGIPYTLATMGTTSVERLAEAVPRGRRWFQLYIWKDRAVTRELVARAAASGFEALVVTIDSAVTGQRLRDVRNGLAIPPAVTARTVLGAARHWQWWLSFLTKEPLSFASLARWDSPLAELGNLLYDATVTVEDIEWIRSLWTGPLVIKGIASVLDADRCAAIGAQAIVLSNHGGRQLDRLPHPLELIDQVRDGLPEHVELWVDSGFTTGGDIVSAYALGADLVLVGRAYLYGLMAAGRPGVTRAIDILTAEVRRTLQLLGCASIAELRREHVRLPAPNELTAPARTAHASVSDHHNGVQRSSSVSPQPPSGASAAFPHSLS